MGAQRGPYSQDDRGPQRRQLRQDAIDMCAQPQPKSVPAYRGWALTCEVLSHTNPSPGHSPVPASAGVDKASSPNKFRALSLKASAQVISDFLSQLLPHNAPLYAPTNTFHCSGNWGDTLVADGHRWAMGRFTHGYDNYIRHAFPHDELKPLSLSHTDSLGAQTGPSLTRCMAALQVVVAMWRNGLKGCWRMPMHM